MKKPISIQAAAAILYIFFFSLSLPVLAETSHNQKVGQMRSYGKITSKSEKKSKNPFKTKLNVKDGTWYLALSPEERLASVEKYYNRKRHSTSGLKPLDQYVAELDRFYMQYNSSMRHVKFDDALEKLFKKDTK